MATGMAISVKWVDPIGKIKIFRPAFYLDHSRGFSISFSHDRRGQGASYQDCIFQGIAKLYTSTEALGINLFGCVIRWDSPERGNARGLADVDISDWRGRSSTVRPHRTVALISPTCDWFSVQQTRLCLSIRTLIQPVHTIPALSRYF